MVTTLSNPKPLHIYPAATILWGPRAEGIGTLIALVILGIGLAGFAVGNLFYTGLWYDESVQFWISRGLSPFAPPLSDPGSLLDVGKYNRLFNLDPGGFSLLLFFWSAVGTDIAWLRLLPFLFFILGLGCFGLLVYSWTRSRLISLLCISMLFWFDLILYHSVEVRAYSMEFAGTMLILYLTRIALLRLSRSTFFILGLVAALFMTSRYSYIIVITGTLLTLIVFLSFHRNLDLKDRLDLIISFSLPIVVIGSLITVLTLGPQISVWMAGSLIKQGAPEYVRHSLLSGKSDDEFFSLLARNLVSWRGAPLTLVSFFGLFILVDTLSKTQLRWSKFLSRFGYAKHTIVQISFIFILSIIVSACGFYPWDIESKWSQYLLALAPVSLAIILTHLTRVPITPNYLRSGISSKLVLMLLFIIISLASLRAGQYRHIYWLNLEPSLSYLSAMLNSHYRAGIWGYEEPTAKYLFEYGPLKGSKNYPKNFSFMGLKPNLDNIPVDFLYSPLSHEELEKLFPAIVLTPEPAWPLIFRINHTPDSTTI